MTATARKRLFVSGAAQAQAREAVTRFPGATLSIENCELETSHHLPDELQRTLAQVLEALAEGKSVLVGASPEQLTTTEAAAQLGISRPTLMKLIHSGELPSSKAGTHHRVATSDVQEFRKRRLEAQRRAYEEMRRLDDLLGH